MKRNSYFLTENLLLHNDAWIVEIIMREKRVEKVVSQVMSKRRKD
jgi:hypothetical protein